MRPFVLDKKLALDIHGSCGRKRHESLVGPLLNTDRMQMVCQTSLLSCRRCLCSENSF